MDQETEQKVQQLFAQVTEALARATWALLNADAGLGRTVVDDDRTIDAQVASVEGALWGDLEALGVLFCDMDTAVREYPEAAMRCRSPGRCVHAR